MTNLPSAREDLIRFVVGPDNKLYPDLGENLPGRGVWLTPSKKLLDEAISKQKFKKCNPNVIIPDGFADALEGLLKQSCLNTLGLANKAGCVLTGFEKIKEKSVKMHFFYSIEAEDGSDKEQRRLGLDETPVLKVFGKEELGHALGQTFCVHLALKKCKLAEKFISQAKSYLAFIGKE